MDDPDMLKRPPVVEHEGDLVTCLADRKLLLVDGSNGTGKSTLARSLTTHLRGSHIAVDCFFQSQWNSDPKPATYAEGVDYEALAVRVKNAMLRGPVVLDGICLLDVVARCGLQGDAHILVTCVDPGKACYLRGSPVLGGRFDGLLADVLLDDTVTLQEVLEGMVSAGAGAPFVQCSVARYFKKYRPHRVAEWIYLQWI